MAQITRPEIWQLLPERAKQRIERWLHLVSAQTDLHRDNDLLDAATGQSDSMQFVTSVLRLITESSDAPLAAFGLRQLARNTPENMNARDKALLKVGSVAALGIPWAVMPIARLWVRERAKHLLCVARLPSDTIHGAGAELLQQLRALSAQQTPAVLNLQGRSILGPEGIRKTLRRLHALAYMPEVEYMLVDIAQIAPGDVLLSDDRLRKAVSVLRDLLREAHENGTEIIIDARNYADSRLAAAAANILLQEPALNDYVFGVTIRAEVPEAAELLTTLVVHSAARIQRGGTKIRVRISDATNYSQESVTSLLTGLPLAVLTNRADIEANVLRLLTQVLASSSLLPQLASDSAYLQAAALELADEYLKQDMFIAELRSSVAPELLVALHKDDVAVRVNLPVIASAEFGSGVPNLLHLISEAADPESSLSRRRLLETEYLRSAELRELETTHLLKVCDNLCSQPGPQTARTQERSMEWGPSERDSELFYQDATGAHLQHTTGLTAAVLGLQTNELTGEIELDDSPIERIVPLTSNTGFRAEPLTDFTLIGNRRWLRQQIAEAKQLVRSEPQQIAPELDFCVQNAPGNSAISDRARVLRKIALLSVQTRDTLVQSLYAAAAIDIATADLYAGSLIDQARYLASAATQLKHVRGADFAPAGNVLVVCADRSLYPQTITHLLSEYAAGNKVTLVFKSNLAEAQLMTKLAAHTCQDWQQAGFSGVQQILCLDTEDLQALIADRAEDSVFVHASVFGSRENLRDIAAANAALNVYLQQPSFSVAVVSAAADIDEAASMIAGDAFGSYGSPQRPVRAVITVGSAWRSGQFREQLADAVREIAGLQAAETDVLAPRAHVFESAPTQAQLHALTEVEKGERWLVTPRMLDENPLIWAPGVKLGVKPESDFWQICQQIPVIGIVHVNSFEEALRAVDALRPSAAALYSWEAAEVVPWCESAQAATLVVNRPLGLPAAESLPGGDWYTGGAAASVLQGGPYQLYPLGKWLPRSGTASSTLHLQGLDPEVSLLIESVQEHLGYNEFDRLRRAALDDALAWRTQLGVARDVTNLGIEHRILRYWPVATHLRIAEDAQLEQIIRVLCAALLVRAPLTVSTGIVLPDAVLAILQQQNIDVKLVGDDLWLTKLSSMAVDAAGRVPRRIRLVAGNAGRLREWLASSLHDIELFAEPVTMAGPATLLSFLREQALGIAANRFGMLAKQPEIAAWVREITR